MDEDDKKAAAEMQVRLKQAEQNAKDNANTKGGLKPDIPSEIVGKGNAAGQVKEKPLNGGSQTVPKKSDKSVGKKSGDKSTPDDSNSKEEMDMAELQAILKKAPGKQSIWPQFCLRTQRGVRNPLLTFLS